MLIPSDIPYLSLVNRKVYLPKGNPIGRKCLVYYYTENIGDTIKEINSQTNLSTLSNYKYYFYNLLYSGKLGTQRYHYRNVDERKAIYTKIKDSTGLIPRMPVSLENFDRNCIFELSKFISIYHEKTDKMPIQNRIKLFWSYLWSVISDPATSLYETKYLIINASSYETSFSGRLKENLKNPIFMIYYTLFRDFTICKNFNIDIIIYYNSKCIKINPSLCDERSYIVFKGLLRKLLPHKERDILMSTNSDEISQEENKEQVKSEVIKSLGLDDYSPSSSTKQNALSSVSLFNKMQDVGGNSIADIQLKDMFTDDDSEDDGEEKEVINDEDEDIDEIIANSEEDIEAPSGEDLRKKVEDKIDDMASKADEEDVEDLVQASIENDKKLLEELYNKAVEQNKPTSSASSARDKKIREEQGKIKVGNMTIDELKEVQSTHMPIPENDVSHSVKTTNKDMKHVKFANFEKTYTEKVLPKDMVNVFTSLNNKSIPLTVIKYDVKDTSDELNYKDTYTVVLEDVNRQRHTITVDIPKFIDDRYMWLGGSKKIILYQNFLYPVVKSGEDEVQIVTNYNKMFIQRFGSKSVSSIERMMKFIETNTDISNKFTVGYPFKQNTEFITTVEYDEYSKHFQLYKNNKCIIYFNQAEATDFADKNGIIVGEDDIFIGLLNDKPIFINQDTQVTENGLSITDIIVETLTKEQQDQYETISAPKRLMYSVATTMKQQVSLALLLGFWEGLNSILNALKLEYRLETKVPSNLKSNESFIRFKNGVLVYKENISQSLVMNGFRIIDTTRYKLEDMETKEPYMDYIAKVYGKQSIANALMNVYEFTIDPITQEILKDLNLPQELVPLCIYANSLLADSQYTPDYNQKLCRIRSSEIIPAILYDSIAKQYVNFKNSNGKKKLSIQRDEVISKLLKLQTVEDSSTLNPLLELERKHTAQYKGFRGINSDHTYTQDKRVYDRSMIGIMGLSTSPDGAVGVQKVLTMEPAVTSARGYLKVEDDKSKLQDVNLFAPAELLCPLGPTRDDPTRTGHGVKQSKHIIPVTHSSPVLISNGAEEIVRFSLSSDFVINAKDDGEVVEVNEKLGLIICKYKDGTSQAIDMHPKIVKNGGGGFYLSNHLVTNLKLGDKFKKDDMLAWHKDFFKSGTYTGNRMNFGTISKIAILSTYNTYQDSTVITEKLSREMSTEMAFNKQVVVGKNATVDFIAKVGDMVDVGSSLIQFDTSYDDSELNSLLNNLSSELQEGVIENSRNNVKSKIAGKIEDIKMYSTVDLSELSPSLQKIFTPYYKAINDRKKLLSNYDPEGSIVKCGLLLDESTNKIVPNKYGLVKGQRVDEGVLIEFYIKHEESLEIGSKVAYYSGLKTTIGEIIPLGFEPYTEFRKDEEISSFVASNSILKRMVPSLLLITLGNKVIIELKRYLREIYDRTLKEPSKMKSEMTSVIYKVFNALDPSKTNTTKYKELFDPMTQEAFKKWFTGFFNNEDAYLILDIKDYANTLRLEYIEKAADIIKVPLFEYVYMPHITMDKSKIIRTRYKVPVGYLHLKRTQQTIAKKNGISMGADIRSPLTGQVTGADKNGRESDLENSMLVALGMTNCLKELNGPRADDMVAKREMLTDIATKGYVKFSDLTYDVNNKTTLNTVNAFFIGMCLDTDLVTKGLMLPSTLKKEL